jgi:DNA-binding transcriptional LysR family regulator
MELRQLRYFVALAEERHFGHAAHVLRIAKPTLSQQLRVLEHDLGVVLVDRQGRGVSLTPAGVVLLRHARILLARAERARDEVIAANGRSEQIMLRVASGAEHVLGPQLRRLVDEARAGLDVITISSVTADAARAVQDEAADAAIVWDRVGRDLSVTTALIQEVPVELALPIEHRLVSSDTIEVADLAEETIVLFPRSISPTVWDRCYRHLLPSGTTRPNQIYIEPDTINAPEALLRAVASGKGLGPAVPAMAVHTQIDGVVLRPLHPPLTLPLELIWREPASPSLHAVLGLLLPDPDRVSVR